TPGSYTVEAVKAGFQRFISKGLVLQVAQEARLDIQLQIGAVEQSVEVSAAAPLLQTEGSTVGQVIDTKPIETLPLNGRNIVQLAVIAPGVTGLSYAQTGTINSGLRPDELRPGGTTLLANGARDSSNQLLLDGIDNTETISLTFVVRPPVEASRSLKPSPTMLALNMAARAAPCWSPAPNPVVTRCMVPHSNTSATRRLTPKTSSTAPTVPFRNTS
ncbi:MAG TPA: carboxypeptidase-like regulatory domain-containing protein, partial [Bryobacteraceae bacterium]